MVDFKLHGRFQATWSLLSELHGRFQISYMVDFTLQCNIGQDSIAISYIMDTFGPRKTLYGSIKKATWFLERLRNLLFLILFSVQFLTGIIPRQAAYHEMSVRSLVFGKAIAVCGSNYPCPTTYDLEHHFQLFGDSFLTWLLSTIHHNDQPAVQSPYLLYPSDTTPALFCWFGTRSTD